METQFSVLDIDEIMEATIILILYYDFNVLFLTLIAYQNLELLYNNTIQ